MCSYPFVCSFYQIQLKMTIDCYIVEKLKLPVTCHSIYISVGLSLIFTNRKDICTYMNIVILEIVRKALKKCW